MISITQFAHEMSTETMDERESFTNRKQWLPENFTSLVESFMVYRTTDQFCSSTEAAPFSCIQDLETRQQAALQRIQEGHQHSLTKT